MKRECHHICNAFAGSQTARYGFGDKLCELCKYAFRPDYDGLFCPCCGGDLKFYYADGQKQYVKNNYSDGYLATIERRKKRQCKWCDTRISKHAAFRIHGNPKDLNSYISFYPEWRSDKLGNVICYDCWRYEWILGHLTQKLTKVADSLITNEIHVPDDILGNLKKVFAMYATAAKPKEQDHVDIYKPLAV